MIGVLIKDENIIANYKAATLIPFALNFIPQTISNYFYPYFSKNYKNKEYIKDKYKKMFKYNLLLNIVITLLLIIFSNLIIKILFGNRYIDSIYLFRIFSVCYFFASTFRIPAGYILSAIGSLKYITYNSFICGILNVTLDIVMIRKYGVYGAALVTLIIFILSGILSNLFLIKILKNKI